MHARKLILTALISAPAVGLLAGAAVDPTMKPKPEPVWRHPATAAFVPTDAYYRIQPPPEDTTPMRWPAGHGRAPQIAAAPVAAPIADVATDEGLASAPATAATAQGDVRVQYGVTATGEVLPEDQSGPAEPVGTDQSAPAIVL